MGARTRTPRQSSRVVNITEYLAARAPRQARLWEEETLPGQPAAALSTRAVAHRARMLAHLAAQPRKAGA
jgi:hypothetical protein